jgi:hypothetical protein
MTCIIYECLSCKAEFSNRKELNEHRSKDHKDALQG